MSNRKSREYLNKLKKKYDVDTIYSWSRYNSYCNDPYGYMLNYIKHVPQTEKDSIYGFSGSVCHEITQDLLEGKIKYEDMITRYEDSLFDMNTKGLKYDKTDPEKNKAIAKKYEDSLRHFFTHYTPLDCKFIIEQFVIINVGRFVIQGYIDCVLRDKEGFYIIEDLKTSTIYTGEKLVKEVGQLILYAESLIQKGIPLEKIKCRYNFLKYCTITSQLIGIDKETKKHKTKEKNCVRSQWVKESSANIKKWLTKEGYDELELEDILQTAIENNNLDNLPLSVQERFSMKDCYVYINLNQDVIDGLKNKIIETLNEVEEKTEKVNEIIKQINGLKNDIKNKKHIEKLENKIDEIFWTEIDRGKEYFMYNLSNYSRKDHKPWDEYLKEMNMFKEDTWGKDSISGNSDEDLSWLDLL